MLYPFYQLVLFFSFYSNLKNCIKIQLTWLLGGQRAWLAKALADR